MEPEFRAGDIIVIEPSKAHKDGSYVIAKKGKDVFFRQIIKEGDWLLKPCNKRYDIVLLGDYQIVGVVVEKSKMYD
jgi:SOS-response transcriptional repressor LexA